VHAGSRRHKHVRAWLLGVRYHSLIKGMHQSSQRTLMLRSGTFANRMKRTRGV